MTLIIDNYDSFTYNLFQYLKELGQDVQVRRNDEISPAVVEQIAPQYIVISPGPGTPSSAGASLPILQSFAGIIPILGICLGHQCIGQAFGAKVAHAKSIMHGKTSRIRHSGGGVFAGLPDPLLVARYHSLAIQKESLPEALEVTAWTDDGEIMGVRHRSLAVDGVQFHPEAILSEMGRELLGNFLARQS